MTQLDRVLGARVSRRSMFKTAGAVGAVSAAGMTLSLGGGMLGKGDLLRAAFNTRTAAAADEDLQSIINIAITAEAMAVTLLGGALASADAGNYDMPLPQLVVDILAAAQAAEQLHYDYLAEAGAVPLTTTFTIPDLSLLTSVETLFGTVVQLETAFVAAYLAAAHRFSQLGLTDLVQISYQTAMVEAEHRVLANYAFGVRPANNYAFYPKLFTTVGEAAQALIDLGFIGGSGTEVTYPGDAGVRYDLITAGMEPGGISAACTPIEPRAGGVAVSTQLRADTVVPGPGYDDAFGFARLVVNESIGQVCVRVSYARMTPAYALHIHEGPRGVAGPKVVDLPVPGPGGLGDGCVIIDAALAARIAADPSSFYVDIHTEGYVGGALRGQLLFT